MEEHSRSVRFHIFKFYLEHCHPPSTEELANLTSLSYENIHNSLKILEDQRHLVLYREDVSSPTPITMVHPFSHLPTPYVVRQGKRSWWANCIWCSFGLASMLPPTDETIYIQTRSGAIGRELNFQISENGVLMNPESTTCVVHFSLPPPRWWDDVRFTCSTNQVFESLDEIEEWCNTHGFPKGATIPIETMWELGKAWYSDKANLEYKRKTPAEAEALFTRLGMTGDFWSLTGKRGFR